MTEDEAIFSSAAPSQQGGNGVLTGLNVIYPFELLEKVAAVWKEHDRLDVLVLRAICQLSARDPVQAQEGFSSLEIVEAVKGLRGRQWSSGDDKNQISDDVRRQWNRLVNKTWAAKQEGIIQSLTDAGVHFLPEPKKTEGGGSGRPSRYRIQWSIANEGAHPLSLPDNPVPHSVSQTIRYICEDIQDAGLLARIFAKGYLMSGWRKILYLAMVIGPLVIGGLALVWVLFVLSLQVATGVTVGLMPLLSLLGMFWVGKITLGPLLDLPVNKIVVAPYWMQSVDDDRLLEHRRPPRYPEKSVKAVRYVSTCPICNGEIVAKSGGLEFWGRIVGRCENAPKEHIYSFDHISRQGRDLRS